MERVYTAAGQFGVLANFAALISLLMCFSQAVIAFILSMVGILWLGSTDLSPHVQAVLMWGFAGLAVFGLSRDRQQHGETLPLILGVISVVIMVATLYGFYHWMILAFAYLCLTAAVFSNQNMELKTLNQKIRQQANELEDWNKTLQDRVAEELSKNKRLENLKRFLSPQIAEIITSPGNEAALASHRGQIAVVFCDLRGFTEFSDSIEPEEVMELLQQYHALLGGLVVQFDGTLHHRAGDGLMVIFNDPLPIDQPVRQALEMALAMREQMEELLAAWERQAYRLGFGVSISYGYATLGIVGHEGRYDYTATGNTVNLAARLCDEAKDQQILLSQKAFIEIEPYVVAQKIAQLQLKGFRDAIDAYNVIGLKSDNARLDAEFAS